MSDLKSKLPDLKELASMSTKFYKDMKKSVCEIIQDYKENRAEEEATETNKEAAQNAKAKPAGTTAKKSKTDEKQ